MAKQKKAFWNNLDKLLVWYRHASYRFCVCSLRTKLGQVRVRVEVLINKLLFGPNRLTQLWLLFIPFALSTSVNSDKMLRSSFMSVM